MLNPVGYQMNAERGRAELVDIWALLTNPVALAAFPHTIAASFMVSSGLVISAAAWHLARNQHDREQPAHQHHLADVHLRRHRLGDAIVHGERRHGYRHEQAAADIRGECQVG
jgi:hypothetical protein